MFVWVGSPRGSDGFTPRPDRRALSLDSARSRLPDLSFLLAVVITVIHVGRTRGGFGLSVGWALEGWIAMIASFALEARGLRLGGLVLLSLAYARRRDVEKQPPESKPSDADRNAA